MKAKSSNKGSYPVPPSHVEFIDAIKKADSDEQLRTILLQCRYYNSDLPFDIQHLTGLLQRIEESILAILARNPAICVDSSQDVESSETLYVDSSEICVYLRFVLTLVRHCCNRRTLLFHNTLGRLLGARSDELAWLAAETVHALVEPPAVYMTSPRDEEHPALQDECLRDRLVPLAEFWHGVCSRTFLPSKESLTDGGALEHHAGGDGQVRQPATLLQCITGDDDVIGSAGCGFFLTYQQDTTDPAPARTPVEIAMREAVRASTVIHCSELPGIRTRVAYAVCYDIADVCKHSALRACLEPGERIAAWRIADALASCWRVPRTAQYTLLTRVRAALCFAGSPLEGLPAPQTVHDLQPRLRPVRVSYLYMQLRALTTFLRCKQTPESIKLLFHPDNTRLADDLVEAVQHCLSRGADELVLAAELQDTYAVRQGESVIAYRTIETQAAACLAALLQLHVEPSKGTRGMIPDDANYALPCMARACRRLGLPLSRYRGQSTGMHGQDIDSLEGTLGQPGTAGVPRDDCGVLLQWLRFTSAFEPSSAVIPARAPVDSSQLNIWPFSPTPKPPFHLCAPAYFRASVQHLVFGQLSAVGFACMGPERLVQYMNTVWSLVPPVPRETATKAEQRAYRLLAVSALQGYLAALGTGGAVAADVAEHLLSSGLLQQVASRLAHAVDTHVRKAGIGLSLEETRSPPGSHSLVRVLPPPEESLRLLLACLMDVLFDAMQPAELDDPERMTSLAASATAMLMPLRKPAVAATPVGGPVWAPSLAPIVEEPTGLMQDTEDAVQGGNVSYALGRLMEAKLDKYPEHFSTDSPLVWAMKDILAYPSAFGGSLVTSVVSLIADIISNDPAACSVAWDVGVTPLAMRVLLCTQQCHVLPQNVFAALAELTMTQSAQERITSYSKVSGSRLSTESTQRSDTHLEQAATGLAAGAPASMVSAGTIASARERAYVTGPATSPTHMEVESAIPLPARETNSARSGRPFIAGYWEWNLAHADRDFSGFQVAHIAGTYLSSIGPHTYVTDEPHKLLLAAIVDRCIKWVSMACHPLPLPTEQSGGLLLRYAALCTTGVSPFSAHHRHSVEAGCAVPLMHNVDLWATGCTEAAGGLTLIRPAQLWQPGCTHPLAITGVVTPSSQHLPEMHRQDVGKEDVEALLLAVQSVHATLATGKNLQVVAVDDTTLLSAPADGYFVCPGWDSDLHSQDRFERVLPNGYTTGVIDKASVADMAKHCAGFMDAMPAVAAAVYEGIRQAFVRYAEAVAGLWDWYGCWLDTNCDAQQDLLASIDSLMERRLTSMLHGLGLLCHLTRSFLRSGMSGQDESLGKLQRCFAVALVHGNVWSTDFMECGEGKDASVYAPVMLNKHSSPEAAKKVFFSKEGQSVWDILAANTQLPSLIDSLYLLIRLPRRCLIPVVVASVQQCVASDSAVVKSELQRCRLLGQMNVDVGRPTFEWDLHAAVHVATTPFAFSDTWLLVQELFSTLQQRCDYGASLAARMFYLLGQSAFVAGMDAQTAKDGGSALAIVRLYWNIHCKGRTSSTNTLYCSSLWDGRTFEQEVASLLGDVLSIACSTMEMAGSMRSMPSPRPTQVTGEAEAGYNRLHDMYAWIASWQALLVEVINPSHQDTALLTTLAGKVRGHLEAAHTLDAAVAALEEQGSSGAVHLATDALELRSTAVAFARFMSLVADLLVLLPPELPAAAGLLPSFPNAESDVLLVSHLGPYADSAAYAVAHALARLACADGVADNSNGAASFSNNEPSNIVAISTAAMAVDICRIVHCVTTGGHSAANEHRHVNRASVANGWILLDEHKDKDREARLNTVLWYALHRLGYASAIVKVPAAFLLWASSLRSPASESERAVLQRGSLVVVHMLEQLSNPTFTLNSGYSMALARAGARVSTAMHLRSTGKDCLITAVGGSVRPGLVLPPAFSVVDFAKALCTTVALAILPVARVCTSESPPVVIRALLHTAWQCVQATDGETTPSTSIACQLGCGLGTHAGKVANLVVDGPQPFNSSVYCTASACLLVDVLVASCRGLRPVILLQNTCPDDPLTGAGDSWAPGLVTVSTGGLEGPWLVCTQCRTKLQPISSTACSACGESLRSDQCIRRQDNSQRKAKETARPTQPRRPSRPAGPTQNDEPAIDNLMGLGFSRSEAVAALRSVGGLGAPEQRRPVMLQAAADMLLSGAVHDLDSDSADEAFGSETSIPQDTELVPQKSADAASPLATDSVLPSVLWASWGLGTSPFASRMTPQLDSMNGDELLQVRSTVSGQLRQAAADVLETLCSAAIVSDWPSARDAGTVSATELIRASDIADAALLSWRLAVLCYERGNCAPMENCLKSVSSAMQAALHAPAPPGLADLLLAAVLGLGQPALWVRKSRPMPLSVRSILHSIIRDAVDLLFRWTPGTIGSELDLAVACLPFLGHCLSALQAKPSGEDLASFSNWTVTPGVDWAAKPDASEAQPGTEILNSVLAVSSLWSASWNLTVDVLAVIAAVLDSQQDCMTDATQLAVEALVAIMSSSRSLCCLEPTVLQCGCALKAAWSDYADPLRALLPALIRLMGRTTCRSGHAALIKRRTMMQSAVQLVASELVADTGLSLWLAVRRYQQRFLVESWKRNQVEMVDSTARTGHGILSSLPLPAVIEAVMGSSSSSVLDVLAFALCTSLAPAFRWVGDIPTVELHSDVAISQALARIIGPVAGSRIPIPPCFVDQDSKGGAWAFIHSQVARLRTSHSKAVLPPLGLADALHANPLAFENDYPEAADLHSASVGLAAAVAELTVVDSTVTTLVAKVSADTSNASAQIMVKFPALIRNAERTFIRAGRSQKALTAATTVNLLPVPTTSMRLLARVLVEQALSAYASQVQHRPSSSDSLHWADSAAFCGVLQAMQHAVELEPRMVTALLRVPADGLEGIMLVQAAMDRLCTRGNEHTTAVPGLEMIGSAACMRSSFLDWLLVRVVPNLVFCDSSGAYVAFAGDGKEPAPSPYRSLFDDEEAHADPEPTCVTPLRVPGIGADVLWRRQLGASASAVLSFLSTVALSCPPASVAVDIILRRILAVMAAASVHSSIEVYGSDARRLAALCSYAAALKNAVVPAMASKITGMKKKEGVHADEDKDEAYVARTNALVRLQLHGVPRSIAVAQMSIDLRAGQAAVTTSHCMAVLCQLCGSDVVQEVGRVVGELTEATLRYASSLTDLLRSMLTVAAAYREAALAAGLQQAHGWPEAVARLRTGALTEPPHTGRQAESSADPFRALVAQAHQQFDSLASRLRSLPDPTSKGHRKLVEALKCLKHWRAPVVAHESAGSQPCSWLLHLYNALQDENVGAKVESFAQCCSSLRALLVTGRHPISSTLGAGTAAWSNIQHVQGPYDRLMVDVRASAVLMARYECALGFDRYAAGTMRRMAYPSSALDPNAAAAGTQAQSLAIEARPAPSQPVIVRKRLRGASFSADTAQSTATATASAPQGGSSDRTRVLQGPNSTPAAARRVRARSGSYSGGGVNEYEDGDADSDLLEASDPSTSTGNAIARLIMDAAAGASGGPGTQLEIQLNVDGDDSALPAILDNVLQQVSAAGSGIRVTAQLHDQSPGSQGDSENEDDGSGSGQIQDGHHSSSGSESSLDHEQPPGAEDDSDVMDEDDYLNENGVLEWEDDGQEEDGQSASGTASADGQSADHEADDDRTDDDQASFDVSHNGEEAVDLDDYMGLGLGSHLDTAAGHSGLFDFDVEDADEEDSFGGSDVSSTVSEAQNDFSGHDREQSVQSQVPARAAPQRNWWADIAQGAHVDGMEAADNADEESSHSSLGDNEADAADDDASIAHTLRRIGRPSGEHGGLEPFAGRQRGLGPALDEDSLSDAASAVAVDDFGFADLHARRGGRGAGRKQHRFPVIDRRIGPIHITLRQASRRREQPPTLRDARMCIRLCNYGTLRLNPTARWSGDARIPAWQVPFSIAQRVEDSLDLACEELLQPTTGPLHGSVPIAALSQEASRPSNLQMCTFNKDLGVLRHGGEYELVTREHPSLPEALLCMYGVERKPQGVTSWQTAVLGDPSAFGILGAMPSAALMVAVPCSVKTKVKKADGARTMLLLAVSASCAPELSYLMLCRDCEDVEVKKLIQDAGRGRGSSSHQGMHVGLRDTTGALLPSDLMVQLLGHADSERRNKSQVDLGSSMPTADTGVPDSTAVQVASARPVLFIDMLQTVCSRSVHAQAPTEQQQTQLSRALVSFPASTYSHLLKAIRHVQRTAFPGHPAVLLLRRRVQAAMAGVVREQTEASTAFFLADDDDNSANMQKPVSRAIAPRELEIEGPSGCFTVHAAVAADSPDEDNESKSSSTAESDTSMELHDVFVRLQCWAACIADLPPLHGAQVPDAVMSSFLAQTRPTAASKDSMVISSEVPVVPVLADPSTDALHGRFEHVDGLWQAALAACCQYLDGLDRCKAAPTAMMLLSFDRSGMASDLHKPLESLVEAAAALDELLVSLQSADDIVKALRWASAGNQLWGCSDSSAEQVLLACSSITSLAQVPVNALSILPAIESVVKSALQCAKSPPVQLVLDLADGVGVYHAATDSLQLKPKPTYQETLFHLSLESGLGSDSGQHYLIMCKGGGAHSSFPVDHLLSCQTTLAVATKWVSIQRTVTRARSHLNGLVQSVKTLASAWSAPQLVSMCCGPTPSTPPGGGFARSHVGDGLAAWTWAFAHAAALRAFPGVSSDDVNRNRVAQRPACPDGFDPVLWGALPDAMLEEARAEFEQSNTASATSMADNDSLDDVMRDEECDETANDAPHSTAASSIDDFVPTVSVLVKPSAWHLESGDTLDHLAQLDDARVASMLEVLSSLGCRVAADTVHDLTSVHAEEGRAAVSDLPGAGHEQPLASTGIGRRALSEDALRNLDVVQFGRTTLAGASAAAVDGPTLARERPLINQVDMAQLQQRAALRLESGPFPRAAISDISRHLAQAAALAAGANMNAAAARISSATRGTTGALQAGRDVFSSTLPSVLNMVGGSDAAWQPTQTSNDAQRRWLFPHNRRSNDWLFGALQDLSRDIANSSDVLALIREYTQTDAHTVSTARERLNPAAGTVVVGAKVSRKSATGNGQVFAFIHHDPPGAQFVELLNRGTSDEVDGACLQRSAAWRSYGLCHPSQWRSLCQRYGISLAHDPAPDKPVIFLRLTASVVGDGLSEEEVGILDAHAHLKDPRAHGSKGKVTEYLFREAMLGSMPSQHVKGLLRILFTGYGLAAGTFTNFCRVLCAHSGTRQLLIDSLLDILDGGAAQSRPAGYAPVSTVSPIGSAGSTDQTGYRVLQNALPACESLFPPQEVFASASLSSLGLTGLPSGIQQSTATWPPPSVLARIFNALGSLVQRDPRVTAYIMGGSEAEAAMLQHDNHHELSAGATTTPGGNSRKRARDPTEECVDRLRRNVQENDSEAKLSPAIPPLHRLMGSLGLPQYKHDVASLSSHVTLVYALLRTLEPAASVHAEAATALARRNLALRSLQRIIDALDCAEEFCLSSPGARSRLQQLSTVLEDLVISGLPLEYGMIQQLASVCKTVTEHGWPAVVQYLCSTACKDLAGPGDVDLSRVSAGKFVQVSIVTQPADTLFTLRMVTRDESQEAGSVIEALVCSISDRNMGHFCQALSRSAARFLSSLSANLSAPDLALLLRFWNVLWGTVAVLGRIIKVATPREGEPEPPLRSAFRAHIMSLTETILCFSGHPRPRPLGSSMDLDLRVRDLLVLDEQHIWSSLQPETASDALSAILEYADFIRDVGTIDGPEAEAVMLENLKRLPDHMVRSAQNRPFAFSVLGWSLPSTKQSVRVPVVHRLSGEVRYWWEPASGYTCCVCESLLNKRMRDGQLAQEQVRELQVKAATRSFVSAASGELMSDQEALGFSPSTKMRFSRGCYVRHGCRFHDSEKDVSCSLCRASPYIEGAYKSSNFTGHIMLRHFWAYTSHGWDTGSDVLNSDTSASGGIFESEEATYQTSLLEQGAPPVWSADRASINHNADRSVIAGAVTLAPIVTADSNAHIDAPASVRMQGMLLACQAGPPSAPMSGFGWHRLPASFVERPHFVGLAAPQLSNQHLKALCAILSFDSCTPVIAARVDASIRLLAALPGNRHRIRAELNAVAASVAAMCSEELRSIVASTSIRSGIASVGTHRTTAVETQAGSRGAYVSCKEDAKLLRILRVLKAVAPRPVLLMHDDVLGKVEALTSVDPSDDHQWRDPEELQSLWQLLEEALTCVAVAEGLHAVDKTEKDTSSRSLLATTPSRAAQRTPIEQHSTSTGAGAQAGAVTLDSRLNGADVVSSRMQAVLARFTACILAFFLYHPLSADESIRGTLLDAEALAPGSHVHNRRIASEPARKVASLPVDESVLHNLRDAAHGQMHISDLGQAAVEPGDSKRGIFSGGNDEGGRRTQRFVAEHRDIVNALVKVEPSLLTGALSFMVTSADARAHLDFYNKRQYFKIALKHYYGKAKDAHVPLFIDRKDILHQSKVAFMRLSGEELRGKLDIAFKGEEGIDAGGLTKEWYEVIARDMFNADYGLFQLSEDGSTYQPHHLSKENFSDHLSWFTFIGRVLGKAIADGYLLDAHFTRSMYKHMLGIPVTYHDMESLDADMYKNLSRLLSSPLAEQGLEDMLTFTVTEEAAFGGGAVDVPLVTGGEDISVTDHNKQIYVALVTERRMTSNIAAQINAMLKGLSDLVPPSLLTLFSPDELELLISGLPNIDVTDLKANTEYVGWRPTDEVIQWFWGAVELMDDTDKARVLMFVTGTSKVPLGGFKDLRSQRGPQKFTIQRALKGDSSLPVSHTCFNTLDLPVYSSSESLREKLLIAIREGGEGFGIA